MEERQLSVWTDRELVAEVGVWCVEGQVGRLRNAWVNEAVGRWMDGWVDECGEIWEEVFSRFVSEWMSEWEDEWVDGQKKMDGWVGGEW